MAGSVRPLLKCQPHEHSNVCARFNLIHVTNSSQWLDTDND